MEPTRTNPKVDFYFAKSQKWQPELLELRRIVLDCLLTEDLKWGVPCYTFQNSNVVLIHAFKEYCAVLFVKGALLHDAPGLLIQQTANTQAARQLRFTAVPEIRAVEAVVKAYVFEAIEVEKAGLEVSYKTTEEFAMPEEFRQQLAETPALQAAFEALSPGRQRAYKLYFAAPKQAKTRTARVAKCAPQILAGKGLNE